MSKTWFRVAVLGNRNATPVSRRLDSLEAARTFAAELATRPQYRQRILTIKQYAMASGPSRVVATHDVEVTQ